MTDWNTTAELDAGITFSTDGGLRQIDRQSKAALAANSTTTAVAKYDTTLFAAFVTRLETEQDTAARRDAIALLLAHDAAVAGKICKTGLRSPTSSSAFTLTQGSCNSFGGPLACSWVTQ